MSPSQGQINRVVALARLLSERQLDRLIAALNSRKLQLNDGALTVLDTVGLTGNIASDLVSLLRDWEQSGSTTTELAVGLATARTAVEYSKVSSSSIQLVWTGPLEAGAQTRSTLLTLQELIATAQQEIVIVGYTITNGAASILEQLAVARLKGIQVTFIANRIEQYREVIRRFWPVNIPGPALFTYPLSDNQIASLHAKVIIVDSQRMLLTSANLTYHGLAGNIELGALIEDEVANRTVRLIQILIDRQIVIPVAF